MFDARDQRGAGSGGQACVGFSSGSAFACSGAASTGCGGSAAGAGSAGSGAGTTAFGIRSTGSPAMRSLAICPDPGRAESQRPNEVLEPETSRTDSAPDSEHPSGEGAG